MSGSTWRDRIAAMLSLRSDPWAGMRQSENIEDRQNEPPVVSVPPPTRQPLSDLPAEETPMGVALGSRDLDHEYMRRLTRAR